MPYSLVIRRGGERGVKMKNIEKYQETKAALEAYNSLGLKMFPFEEWIECEYEEPSKQTLLESAETLTDAWFNGGTIDGVKKKILILADAIEREKKKPVRNCDVGSAEDQLERHEEWCERHRCTSTLCRLCFARWSQMQYESEKDEAK